MDELDFTRSEKWIGENGNFNCRCPGKIIVVDHHAPRHANFGIVGRCQAEARSNPAAEYEFA